ncbi:RNA-binding protein [archaeon]|nr:MAG: RNA-binding protein [archaeon]
MQGCTRQHMAMGDDAEDGCALHVSGLSHRVTAAHIREIFGRWGGLVACTLSPPCLPAKGRAPATRTASVVMDSPHAAEAVVVAMDGVRERA